jgi:hypothetical protein
VAKVIRKLGVIAATISFGIAQLRADVFTCAAKPVCLNRRECQTRTNAVPHEE